MQKGFRIVYLLVGISGILILVGSFYFGKYIEKNMVGNKIDISSPAPVSMTNKDYLEEKDFSIYPGATVVKQGTFDIAEDSGISCKDLPNWAVCKGKYYNLVSDEDANKIVKWYFKVYEDMGWRCSGGAGEYSSEEDYSGFGYNCIKETKKIELNYSRRGNVSEINIAISN